MRNHGMSVAALVAVSGLACAAAAHAETGGSPGGGWARPGLAPALVEATPRSVVVEVSVDQIASAAASAPGLAESVRIDGVPLDLDRTVSLDLVRFRVAAPGARFEIVGAEGARPMDFDPESVVLLRGSVSGYPDSHVFIAMGRETSNGWIDLGPGAAVIGQPRKFWVREAGGRGGGGVGAGSSIPGSIALEIFPAVKGPEGGQGQIPAAMCGTLPSGPSEGEGTNGRLMIPPKVDPVMPPANPGGVDMGPVLGMKQVEVAVDTDQEYRSLFPTATAAGEYIMTLYGAMSDLYIREVRATVVVTYFRLWETPDPWTQADPLNNFRNTWNNTQQAVPRDTAQLLLGRANLSAGGVAYLPGLCDGSGYSWAGYVLGKFGDLDRTDDYSRDLGISAHELGHNVGANHNHFYGLDTCQNANTPAARGGLMAYCGQTVSGAGGNIDLRFETRVRTDIRATLDAKACIASDCNLNGVSDATDITLGTSLDVNADGVPDECQDCNANLVLDPIEISLGQVPDVNANGLPDSCDPDCNNNGVPDDRDILLGTSTDAYLNGVPDECEADCNGNNISDYTELRLNMPLDVDRDLILDECQDCDNDQTIDRYELEHSHHIWVSSLTDSSVREFHSASGVLTQVSAGSAGGGITSGGDVLITPDGRIFATSTDDARIIEYAVDGSILGDLAGPAQGLNQPTFMTLDPAGDLLVSNTGTNAVLKFDLPSGAPMGAIVAAGAGGLAAPYGLAYGPDGHLYVASSTANRVLKFNGATGAFMSNFTGAGSGGLSAPRGVCWLPDGHLLVASSNTFNIVRYNGTTGASMGTWQTGGNGSVLVLDQPWDIVIGPTGDVFASASGLGPESVGGGTAPLHVTTARVFQYNPVNGWMIRAYVVGQDTGLYRASGLAFYPDFGTDCNLNALPDNCDISAGRSLDYNHNDRPDECECVPDVTTGAVSGQPGYGVPDGVLNNDDFFYYLGLFAAADPDADWTTTAIPGSPGYGVQNGVVNNDDFFFYLSLFAGGC